MAESHELMGGKVRVYRRENSSSWQCSTYLHGKNWRVSTKEDSLSHAKDFAEDWYIGLRGKSRAGQLKTGKTFRQAAEQFLLEYEVITKGERSTFCFARLPTNAPSDAPATQTACEKHCSNSGQFVSDKSFPRFNITDA